MLEFLQESNFICPQQSRFRSFDSCQSQLLSIVHDIYASFEQNPTLEVGANLQDISKAFDKIWQKGVTIQAEASTEQQLQIRKRLKK